MDSSKIDRALVNKIAKEHFGFETKLTDNLIKEALDPTRIAEAKKCLGGTAMAEVKRQLDLLEDQIEKDEKILADRVVQIENAALNLRASVKELEEV